MSRHAFLLVGYLTFVVYGSLVPLDYHAVSWQDALQAFRQIPFLQLGVESRADWIANGVLYAPLGYLSAGSLRRAVPRGPFWWVGAVLLCSAVAVAVEFAQLFFPPRTVSQNDLIAEVLGSIVGATLLPWGARWAHQLRLTWAGGAGAHISRHLLELYLAAYVVMCFFPFDLLMSGSELHQKTLSDNWGWVLATSARGSFFVVLQLAVEVALAAPIGYLLARQWRNRAGSAALAFSTGLALGLFIEIGQFFIASGVSQGLSVLTRACAVTFGTWLAPRVMHWKLADVRRYARRWLPVWLPVYLLLLMAANGWFTGAWRGAAHAAVAWAELHWLPFYYHYYTTEAIALFSLSAVSLMYLPLAAAAWARGWAAPFSLGLVACSTGLIEGAKLFMAGLHPDPTNVLIATASAAATLWLLRQLELAPGSQAGLGRAEAARNSAQLPPLSTSPKPPGTSWPWLAALPAVAVGVAVFPVWNLALLVLLVACAGLVWRWPVLVLALVPAALPVLDLAPWAGHRLWDEMDLLLATTLAIGLARAPGRVGGAAWRPLTLAFGLLGLSLALSTARALWSAEFPDANSFSNFFSPWSAVRITKGAIWAWLFAVLWTRLPDGGQARAHCFSAGMLVGLTLTVAVILWERATFASLFDFAADFRVTGPFSAMHRGGAYVECYLAVAAAFAMAWGVRATSAVKRLAAAALLATTCYAVMVTYSRNGYAALALALLLTLALQVDWRRRTLRTWASVGVVMAVVLAATLPIVLGSYALERMAQTGRDLAVRQAHWADGLKMRDEGWLTSIIGMGIGRFPETHFWRSQEAQRAASYRLATENGNAFLRLGPGAKLYVEQIVAWPATGKLLLAMDLRAPRGTAALAATLCEKWILTSRHCVNVTVSTPSSSPSTAWQTVEIDFDPTSLQGSSWPLRAPLKLSLATPDGTSTVDVDNVRLTPTAGGALLRNGDFSAGMDHWSFATDVDPPWHMHNLILGVLFDQGVLGVLAWVAVMLGAMGIAAKLAWRGRALLPAAAAGAAAFLVSGSLNTLIDSPRFLWMLLVLLWLASLPASDGRANAAEADLDSPLGHR